MPAVRDSLTPTRLVPSSRTCVPDCRQGAKSGNGCEAALLGCHRYADQGRPSDVPRPPMSLPSVAVAARELLPEALAGASPWLLVVRFCLGGAFDWHRSEERRGGKECVSTCKSRWSPQH